MCYEWHCRAPTFKKSPRSKHINEDVVQTPLKKSDNSFVVLWIGRRPWKRSQSNQPRAHQQLNDKRAAELVDGRAAFWRFASCMSHPHLIIRT